MRFVEALEGGERIKVARGKNKKEKKDFSKRDNQIEGDARKIRVGQYGHSNDDLMPFVVLSKAEFKSHCIYPIVLCISWGERT
jgi:hypothetical protein